MIIRKTNEPVHAKLYFFNLKEGQAKQKIFIVGSSNLTKFGLLREHEFNVEISDYGCKEAEEYFDKLWDKATKITENNVTKDKLINIIRNNTFVTKITPFEAYVYILYQYIENYKNKDISENLIDKFKNNNYTPYKYQLDAIKQALKVIESTNGVILADVVGLGKSIIACAIAYELRQRGVVIAPPALIEDDTKTTRWKNILKTLDYQQSVGKHTLVATSKI